jgi:hypothetical protein
MAQQPLDEGQPRHEVLAKHIKQGLLITDGIKKGQAALPAKKPKSIPLGAQTLLYLIRCSTNCGDRFGYLPVHAY